MTKPIKSVELGQSEDGFAILLDGRPVRTPKRSPLSLPTRGLAELLCQEWRARIDQPRPLAMPLTRLATSVIDLMPEHREDALSEVLDYGVTDLLCYRAAEPAGLRARQIAAWQPWLDWADKELGAGLVVTDSIEPIPQPQRALDALAVAAGALDDWRLIGLHAATKLTGSMVLGLAMTRRLLDAEAALAAALVDELYSVERWGLEEEQERRHASMARDLAAVAAFLQALDQS